MEEETKTETLPVQKPEKEEDKKGSGEHID